MSLADDIDEDLDEMDDEDIDDALSEDDHAERRRRRRARVRGRGYASPRRDTAPVSQTQMQAALARVAADVRKLAANQRDLESRVGKELKTVGSATAQSAQMLALLPLLTKRSKTLTEIAALPADERARLRLSIDSNDSLTTLLPLMMMGGMGGMGGTGTTSTGGGDNSMMMLVLAMTLANKN